MSGIKIKDISMTNFTYEKCVECGTIYRRATRKRPGRMINIKVRPVNVITCSDKCARKRRYMDR